MTIEQYSQHPIATAILERSNKLQIAPLQSGNFQSITGKGAKTTINNRTYYIGNKRLFKEMNAITINDEIVQQINDLENLGNTVMMLGTRENILGIIAVADQIREESKSIIERLYQLGIQKTFMLTGDNELTANAIASEVDITDVKANLLPEDKLNVIKNLQEKHKRVAMVGDGVNDAPALATASIGVAMGGTGTDTALETAEIALMSDDLRSEERRVGKECRARWMRESRLREKRR